MLLIIACNENNLEGDNDSKEIVNSTENEEIVYMNNNMLVFQDYAHINREIAKFNRLSENSKKEWLNNYGIQTYGQIFREVIIMEDSISNYYFSLPDEEQKYFLSNNLKFTLAFIKKL